MLKSAATTPLVYRHEGKGWSGGVVCLKEGCGYEGVICTKVGCGMRSVCTKEGCGYEGVTCTKVGCGYEKCVY